MSENTESVKPPRLLKLAEVADALAISVTHLRREIRQRRLAVYRLGKNLRVSEADLAEYVAKRRRSPR